MFKVVCIVPYEVLGLIKGNEYIVSETHTCSCGQETWYVGLSVTPNSKSICYCHNHIHSTKWFADPKRFVISDSFATELLERIKEEINQEQLVNV